MRNLYCTIHSVIWGILWFWGTYTELLHFFSDLNTVVLHVFSDLRNPVNLRNLYWIASFIQLSEESSQSEEPILNCFIYSGILGIQWIRGTDYILLHLFSYLRNPVNLRNLYWTALFIQWSEESSASKEPILYCFIHSVIWEIQWIWGTVTVLFHQFSEMRNPVNLWNKYWIALFIRWLRNPVHLRNLYWTILYLFSDLTKPVNLGNLYCTASFIQWSDEYSKSEVPILNCFIYSVIWGI